MRSFGSHGRALIAVSAVWLFVSAAGLAQAPKSLTAKQQFDEAAARDDKIRLVLTNYTDAVAAKDMAAQVGQAVSSFEALVRRFPASAYADDALWRAASLSEAAYQRLNRPEDRDKAFKMYRRLIQEYPKSAYAKQAGTKVAGATKATVPPAAAASKPAVTAKAPSPLQGRALVLLAITAAPVAAHPAHLVIDAAENDLATLTAIQRTVLPDAVRVTLELDREVSYKEERLGGPARLFFDLKNVETTAELKDKVLSYGSDVVSKIRVGRHPDNTVRVVLDLEDVSRYSVFTLYSPFRLVIDAERPRPRTAAAGQPATPVAELPPALVPSATKAKPTVIVEPTPLPPVPEALSGAAPATGTPAAAVAPPGAPAANAAGGFSIARQLGLTVSRIVIDPGHGGHDPGTIAKGLTEAQLTLEVALRLEKLLQKEPGVEVVLTRRTDVYVPLEERTAIANRTSADLFLSIHANSSRNTTARGIETYFLSFASSPDAEAIAARENAGSEREMHQLPDIIKAISLNNKLDESRDLANMIQESLVSTLRKSNRDVRSRGVKKAPFVVLIGAAMPSVLAEISFLTNRQELSLLKTSSYKDRIAQALNNAVLRYRKSLKGATVATIER
jgi:N-acetylmuramoyl-L-alanine amidase